jgi:hypothetical protein
MYGRLGHRLTTFIGPWPCAARIARCPPVGLIPRYRPDEFMSEVISIFPVAPNPSPEEAKRIGRFPFVFRFFFLSFFYYLLMAR